jgi:acyl-CoA dehydrogenase
MAHPFYTEEHEAFRSVLQSFVANEITPCVNDWDEAETFPGWIDRSAPRKRGLRC